MYVRVGYVNLTVCHAIVRSVNVAGVLVVVRARVVVRLQLLIRREFVIYRRPRVAIRFSVRWSRLRQVVVFQEEVVVRGDFCPVGNCQIVAVQ